MDVRRDEPGLRSETVRRANISALVRELHDSGPLSRSDLGLRTGLTRSTVRALTGELAAAGLVSEIDPGPLGTPGRPSVLVRPNPTQPIALALEIAVDSVAGAVVGFGGQVIEQLRVERPRGELSVDHTIGVLSDLARSLRTFDPHEAVGIGVAVAGVVRHADGFVWIAPNLGWREVPLGRALGEALGNSVPLSIANEADLGALAEARRGSARGCDNVLLVWGEVGVGGGAIVNGRQMAGTAGYAGEVGHMPINPAGAACRCGSRGCWETEIGEDALLVKAGQRRGGGRSAVDEVLRDAQAGDDRARAAVEDVGRWLGMGLGGLVNVLNPERIVLGRLFGRMHPLVADIVARQLDRYALAAARSLVSVAPAQLGDEAVLLGAAELAFEPFLVDPAAWLRPRSPVLVEATA